MGGYVSGWLSGWLDGWLGGWLGECWVSLSEYRKK